MDGLSAALSSPIVPAFQGNSVVSMAAHGSDKNMQVRFFAQADYMPFLSTESGKAIYETHEYVHIYAPGAKTDVTHPVQMEDRMDVPSHPHRFPKQWEQFRAQQEQVAEGTPLEMCAFIAKHRVLELKSQRIHTAEQYAGLPDSVLQGLGIGARREKELCKAYISEDEKMKALSRATAANEAMQSQISVLTQQVHALANQTGQQIPEIDTEEAPRQKRKWTRKNVEGVAA